MEQEAPTTTSVARRPSKAVLQVGPSEGFSITGPAVRAITVSSSPTRLSPSETPRPASVPCTRPSAAVGLQRKAHVVDPTFRHDVAEAVVPALATVPQSCLRRPRGDRRQPTLLPPVGARPERRAKTTNGLPVGLRRRSRLVKPTNAPPVGEVSRVRIRPDFCLRFCPKAFTGSARSSGAKPRLATAAPLENQENRINGPRPAA